MEAMEPYIEIGKQMGIALAIFVVGWIASKWAHSLVLKVIRSRKVDEALARFLASIVRYLVLAAAVIASLGKVGVETTSLVAMLGTVGLAIGLALQGSLAHFAAGVMILFFRPFTLGDVISAGGHMGVVKDIGLFATTLNTPDNETVIIPNGSVTGGPLVNYTVLGTRRGKVQIGVAYGADMQKVQEVLLAAAKRTELVLEDPEPAVAFVGFGASSLDFIVFGWSTADDYLGMLHNLRVSIYDDLNAAGIEIPFNQIVVHNAA